MVRRVGCAAPSSEGGERIVLEREEREKERKRKGKRKEKRKKREKREGKGKERKEKRKKKRERSCKKEKEGRRRMVEEKKERRKEEKKEREERVGGESVPCTSTAAEASDRRPSWTCTSAGSRPRLGRVPSLTPSVPVVNTYPLVHR